MNDAAFKNSFPNHLDKAVAAGQDGQTMGIPIGPDTSRIMAELIATEIEELARLSIDDFDRRCVRYVDDMIIGLREDETSASVLSAISSALYEFELELSGDKTSTYGIGCPHSPEWIHTVRSFSISTATSRQRDDIDSFFEQALHLCDENPKENVLLFAAKRAGSFSISASNWDHFVRWLLYISRRSPGCLSFVVGYLSAAARSGRRLPISDVSDFIRNQIPSNAESAQTSEVAWLIFFARELGIHLEARLLERVTNLRSSVCALLTLDMLQRGRISGRINTRFWRSFANEQGLKSEMWLVAYEATLKKWWPTPVASSFIRSHQFFGDLWKQKVSFYDPSARAPMMTLPSPLTNLTAFVAAAGGGSSDYP